MIALDLVIQGPTAGLLEAQDLSSLTGASDIRAVGSHAYRLLKTRTQHGVAEYCSDRSLDFAFVPPDMRFEDFRVLAMDMDSTLIRIECIDEIADMAGIKPQVALITAAAMRGEMEFEESLRRRVKLLDGLPVSTLERVYRERLEFSPGAERLLLQAHARGLKTLLVSGGFSFFVDRLKAQLAIDYAYSNVLEVEEDKLTGKVQGDVFGAQAKADALSATCTGLGITPKQAIVLGDGANDLPMMALAGISVAYKAKPVVRQHATYALSHVGLDGVLNLFA